MSWRSSSCVLLLILAIVLAACTDVKPVVKIGLIAPFEGLHRRSGYAALDAMRAALADYPSPTVSVLPLALDDSSDPDKAHRAAQKLLAVASVGAIVGPLSPAEAAASADVVETSGVPWFLPFAPASMRGQTGETLWSTALVMAAAGLAAQQGAEGLVLVGQTPGWPVLSAAQWSNVAGLPVRFAEDPAAVQDFEAVFWMGSAEDGAAYLNALRQHQPDVPFWIGPPGSDPVFTERIEGGAGVFWVIWSDEGYNSWAETHSPSTPAAYLVYRATVDALLSVTGRARPQLPSTWFVQAYALVQDGESVQYSPVD